MSSLTAFRAKAGYWFQSRTVLCGMSLIKVSAFCLVLVFLKCQGEALKTFDFVDYKDVPVEDSGWLKLKQDPKNPLHLPHSFAFCTNVFRWYSRSSYIGYISIKLLDEE